MFSFNTKEYTSQNRKDTGVEKNKLLVTSHVILFKSSKKIIQSSFHGSSGPESVDRSPIAIAAYCQLSWIELPLHLV